MNSKRFLSLLALLPVVMAVLFFSVTAQGAGSWPELSVVTNGSDQVYPAISGSIVVWQDYRNKTGTYGTNCSSATSCTRADIYALDLNSGTERRLTAAPNGLDPAISGNTVVWRDWITSKIVAHNLTNDTQQNVNISSAQVATPAISGSKVVWVDFRNSTQYGDIYMRDLTQPVDAPVSLGSSLGAVDNKKKDKLNPAIDGNIVVWEDWRNAVQDPSGWWGNPDIYMKNLATGAVQPVCTNAKDQYNPVVSGNRIFWQDSRNGNWDIYMYDVATATETRLTTSFAEQSWPSVSGDVMVWKDKTTGAEDVRVRNLATGAEMVVTADADSQKIPVISGDNMAWMDYRAGNWDIYRSTDDGPPAVTADGPSGTLTSTSTTITASYADSISGINPASVSVTLDGSPVGGCTATATGVSCPVSSLAQGAHSYSVSVSDQMGNTGTASGSFSVDSVAPAITSPAPTGTIAADSTAIGALYSDPAPGTGINTASVSVTLDSNLVVSCAATATSVSCPVSGLAQGEHSYSISVSDLTGNTGTASGSFSVDSAVPDITGLEPAGTIATSSPTIAASYADAIAGIDTASVSVTLDSNLVVSCAATATSVSCPVSGLAQGEHSYSISVSDLTGNTGTASGSFSIDSFAPVITSPAPTGAIYSNSAVITADFSDPPPGTGTNPASVSVTLDGNPVGGCTATAADVSCPVSGVANGNHQVVVSVSDALGNAASHTWSFSVNEPPLINNIYPAAGAVINNPYTNIGAAYSSNGDGINLASVKVFLDGGDVTSAASLNASAAIWLPPGRLDDGVHTARVEVADMTGRVTEQIWSFTVTSPQLSLNASSIYWSSYDAYVDGVLSVDYLLQNPGTGSCVSGQVASGAATNGVMPLGPLPAALGTLTPGATATMTLDYMVPPGVSRFVATSYASCNDDGGNAYWMPGLPPG